MSKKSDEIFRQQVNEAIDKVRASATEQSDYYRGMQAGASAVGWKLSEIRRRDEALKAEGIPRGSA